MKRRHRHYHRLVWPLLLVCAAAAVGLALLSRPWVPQNPDWPPALAAVSA